MWYRSISDCSHRKLSLPSDKLAACAALAEHSANIFDWEASEYLAGLWKQDIAAQLLWYREEDASAERFCKPTWSWAFLDGPVKFCLDRQPRVASYKLRARATLEKFEIIPKVKGNNYCGADSGRLWLNGKLRQMHWDGACLRRSTDSSQMLLLLTRWDSSGTIEPRIVWCFETLGTFNPFGLLLDTTNGTDFERVGCFEYTGPILSAHLFDDIEPRTIILH